jgi:integrase
VTEFKGEPMGVHGLHRWWYRCLARSGVVASGQTSGKRNLEAVQKLLGHSSITTTADIYTNWDIDQQEETMRQVAQRRGEK